MADIQKVVDWTLANASKLRLKITKVTWIDEWLPGYSDYQVKISIKNNNYIGRGIDKDEPIAFVKAIAESFDRAAVADLEIPWACASHTNIKSASENAYHELLSIDRAICHHCCKKRFYPLPVEILKNQLPLKMLQEMLYKHNLELKIYELKPTKDVQVVQAIVWNNNPNCKIPGFVNGFGAGFPIESAAKHAVLECLRTAVAVFLGDFKLKESLQSLMHQKSPRWHFWMAQTEKALQYLQKHLVPLDGEEVHLDPENISINDVQFTRINKLQDIFPDIPLVFVQAHSDKLIRPQFGEFVADEQTIKRLETFNGSTVVLDASVPHFYG